MMSENSEMLGVIVWHRYRFTSVIAVVPKIVKAAPMVASKGTLYLMGTMVDDSTLIFLCGFSYVMGRFSTIVVHI